MGTERTALGKATLIILNIGFGAIAFVCLVGLVAMGFIPDEGYPSMRGIMIFMGLIIFGIIAYVAFLYWNAYRKNEPQKLNTVSTVIFVIYFICFCLFAMSIDVVQKMDMSEYLDMTQNFDVRGSVIGMLTSLIALGIIMAEVKMHKKGRISPTMKYAWVPVLALMAYSFVSVIYSGLFGRISAAVIIGFAVSLCMHAGIVLLSCWIVNQEKFYVKNFRDNASGQGIQNPSFDGSAY